VSKADGGKQNLRRKVMKVKHWILWKRYLYIIFHVRKIYILLCDAKGMYDRLNYIGDHSSDAIMFNGHFPDKLRQLFSKKVVKY
jgi:hypothetical protein